MTRSEVVFVFNLLQDVNIQRGLVYLAHRETDAAVHLLVTQGFLKRDSHGIWQRELADLARDTGAQTHVVQNGADAQAALQGRGGVLICASESDLGAHRETATIQRAAPASFITVTLQHGLECVGFRQSREHNIGHTRNVGWNADVVCTWLEPDQLTATRADQRSKVIVTGPATLLQRPRAHPAHPPLGGGIVCENMHSVRLSATGAHRVSFMETFFDFCTQMDIQNQKVTLRPHPGGQYMLKNNVDLARNVLLNNLPIYDVNLRGYLYGISAPSTVVLDMVLAGIPAGVWCDPEGVMDLGNYTGLTRISTLPDWLAFAQEARENPAPILMRQQGYLRTLGLVSDPDEIYRRYTHLLRNMLGLPQPVARAPVTGLPAQTPKKRIMYVANSILATLQLSFLKPLAEAVARGDIVEDFITEGDFVEKFAGQRNQRVAADWVEERIRSFAPDIIVCCRYSGPQSGKIAQLAKEMGVPLIYHIDDDLLDIPKELGEVKWRMHNDPKRLANVRGLLNNAALVYASTPGLYQRLRGYSVKAPLMHGDIYCASTVLRAARNGPVRKVGYMGTSGHLHDFEFILPAITRYLDANPAVTFELFGLETPDALRRFGARVHVVPPVASYAAFLQTLADRDWDIGLCPLAHTPFNAVKANTKWVEYTTCGMATIATKGLVYDECAGQGRGLLVGRNGWLDAMQKLTDDPQLHFDTASRAQAHLRTRYAPARLRDQVFDVFEKAEMAWQSPYRARRMFDALDANSSTRLHILFISNDTIPTLQLSFLKPLAQQFGNQTMSYDMLTESDLNAKFGLDRHSDEAVDWFEKQILDANPDMIVCCRYSGPHSKTILSTAQKLDVPVIYHVDDDLRNIPREIGEAKYKAHNNPGRLACVTTLLSNATMVYASTFALKTRLRTQGVATPIFYGDVYCTSRLLRTATPGPVRRIGYMGFDHAHDFETALSALETYLDRHTDVEFELFGSIPMPECLLRFGDRVRSVPPVRNYAEFLQALADRAWDIGICPLAHTPFNAVKANTKWIEYTACGMATIATKGLVYDDCAGQGRGLLVKQSEWLDALEVLTADPGLRYTMALQAQAHLLLNYSERHLTDQVLAAFARARDLHEQASGAQDTHARLLSAQFDAKGQIRTVSA
jgi:hypothetical protein